MSARYTVCTAVALAAATVLATVPAAAEPGPPIQSSTSVSALLTSLQKLYRQAEEAGEAYNATEEALTKQQAETARLARAVARARSALALSRQDAGRLAREQYQGRSELSTYLQLLLAKNPRQALQQDHLIERAATGRLATMTRLEAGTRRANALAAESRRALHREETLTALRRQARDKATARLKKVEETLAALSAEELAELAALERSDTAKAQGKLLATGVLDGERTPSAEGGRALQYAVEQLGKPYLWGAEGPQAYDCSGLTSQAWARAGRTIPRTSQEQWKQLPKVPLRELRPGDLVVYFPRATHVAMYLGDGMVVQAPRPGTRVKISPIAANPLLGAVRPDPGGPALSSYTPPKPPAHLYGEDSTSDAGYAAESAPSGG